MGTHVPASKSSHWIALGNAVIPIPLTLNTAQKPWFNGRSTYIWDHVGVLILEGWD